MSRCKFFFNIRTEFINFLLALINILTKRFCILTMAGLTRTIDVSQRTCDMMIRKLYTTLRDVWHMTISTRNTTLTMNTPVRRVHNQDAEPSKF